MSKLKLILGLVLVLILVGLGITIVVQKNKIDNLNEDLIIATTNIKAYEAETSYLNDEKLQFQLTVDQLNASNDSLVQKLNSARKSLKIKDNKIKELEYIASENQKVDSIFVKDTIFIRDAILDTLIHDQWSSLDLHLEYPNVVVANYSFKNEMSVITSLERVTVDPPKKCWLCRLFQKKQDVITVDIVQENPYCTIKEEKYIKVVK